MSISSTTSQGPFPPQSSTSSSSSPQASTPALEAFSQAYIQKHLVDVGLPFSDLASLSASAKSIRQGFIFLPERRVRILRGLILAKALKIAKSVKETYARGEAFVDIIHAQAKNDIEVAINMLDLIENENLYYQARQNIFTELMKNDPNGIREIAREKTLYEEVHEIIKRMVVHNEIEDLSEDEKILMNCLDEEKPKYDFNKLIKITHEEFTENNDLNFFLGYFFIRQAKNDPKRAMKNAQEMIEDSKIRDEALYEIIKEQAKSDIKKALSAINSILSKSIQARALASIAAHCNVKNLPPILQTTEDEKPLVTGYVKLVAQVVHSKGICLRRHSY